MLSITSSPVVKQNVAQSSACIEGNLGSVALHRFQIGAILLKAKPQSNKH
jgi:hypothetical protein